MRAGGQASSSGEVLLRFKCAGCDEWHDGVPGFAADAPLYFYSVPPAERAARCELTNDTCIVDEEAFFARGCIEIPIARETDPFIWGVWVSLSKPSFEAFKASLGLSRRSDIGPFFGWLSAEFLVYPPSENLKTKLHLRDAGLRPWIELEPTDHPLAVEQREGISPDRVAEIYAAYIRADRPTPEP
jgi:hypothetical protein